MLLIELVKKCFSDSNVVKIGTNAVDFLVGLVTLARYEQDIARAC
jgi:hypothetical protein